jgi:hypothetical protein
MRHHRKLSGQSPNINPNERSPRPGFYTAPGTRPAAAIFGDTRPHPLFPRWSAYLSLWNALLLVPGGLMAFFKIGPFAWDGIFAFYIPLLVFFVWLISMTVLMLRASRAVLATNSR